MDVEVIREMYLGKNMTQEEIAKELGSTLNHIGYLIRKNGIKKDNSQKAFSSIKKRNLREAKRKREQTVFKKYGVKNVFESPEWQEKAHNNQRKKNGGKLAFNTQKQKDTLVKKYGVDNIQKLSSARKKREETNLSKYGVASAFLLEEAREKATKNNGHTISQINKKWQALLKKELGIDFILEKDHFDLVYQNLAIDINPTFTHNSTFSYAYITGRSKENKPLPRDYHYKRYLQAKEKGYLLLSIFDWYETEKVIDLIRSKLKLCENVLNARDCKIEKVPTKKAKEFIERNHIQGWTNAIICYGLFNAGKLVEIATFGKPRLRKDADYELIRLCSEANYVIKGGVTKLISHFKKNYPGVLISYTNLNISQSSGKYVFPAGSWVKGKRRISEVSVLKRGASRLIGDNNFQKYPKGMKNEEIMIKEGWVKVYDCGSALNIL